MLTSHIIKEKAYEFGADLCGISPIERFADTQLQRDPRMILPNAKSVICFAFRVPRMLYFTMQEKRQYFNYTQLGVKFIDEELAEIFLLKMGGVIEDEGFDACLQRNTSNLKIKGDHSTNPELLETYELVFSEPVAKGKAAPDVILDFNAGAKACGIGEVGDSGHLLTPKFGPFVRLAFIVTDAILDPDPEFTENLCDHCKQCQTSCPGNAISDQGCDSWQCSVYYRGAHRSNPFMSDDFLIDHPERELILNGEKKFDKESATALYPKLDFLPSRSTGYAPCLCGKSCDMACYNHLKSTGKLQ